MLADVIFPLKIVGQFSAVMDGFNVKQFGIHGNHTDICKLQDLDDAGYKRISQEIRSLLSEVISGESPAAS